MKAIEAVLLTLRANAEAEAAGGESMPIGRTAMQKLVYFESAHTGVEAEYTATITGRSASASPRGLRACGSGAMSTKMSQPTTIQGTRTP